MVPWNSASGLFDQLLYYDTTIDGKRYKTMARYNKQKNRLWPRSQEKQQQLVDELNLGQKTFLDKQHNKRTSYRN